jgi:uncharacterized repeat protein (TIGR03803 family)
LVQASDGTLYGNTQTSGTNIPNAGTIFKITTNGALTTLFKFHLTDGALPANKMIFGPDGNLYGTTTGGGLDHSFTGFGTVFRITTNGVFTPLVLFRGTNGFNPEASVAFGPDGNLYGTTFDGGTGGGGTIFRIVLTSQPQLVVLRNPAKLSNGALRFGFSATPGASFTVIAATNISLPLNNWTTLGAATEISPGQFQFTDLGATNQVRRFYRVHSN